MRMKAGHNPAYIEDYADGRITNTALLLDVIGRESTNMSNPSQRRVHLLTCK